MRIVRDQRGQASIEVVGMLPLLLLAAMFVWELHLIASASNAVENAARTGSRVEGLGGDGRKAAIRALPTYQREGAEVRIDGEKVTIKTGVPILVPGLKTGLFEVDGSAELPAAGGI